ncbi:hypothetical protein IWW43_006102 [Coemansia sp. RSA 1935]|nr:hypothetical protein IWW43_006102 [Coemansia sp. RSA 1935]
MFFTKAKTAIKTTARRIFKRAANSNRNADNSGSVTTTAIKAVAKRIFQRSNINSSCASDNSRDNGSSLNSACIDGTSTSDIGDSNRCDNTETSSLNSACIDGTSTSDGSTNCASDRSSASNTAVSASVRTNSNSGSTAIDSNNCDSHDRISKAVAALYEACAARFEPKPIFAPKWAFERTPAHQPRRCFKGSPQLTMSLGELMEARKKGLLQASSKDWLLTNNEAHKLFVEPIVEALTPIPCRDMQIIPYY